MDFKKNLRQASDIVLLNEETMKSVAHDSDLLKPGLLILGVASILEAMGHYFFPGGGIIIYRPDLFTVFTNAVQSFVVTVVALYLVGYIVQEFFKGHLKMDEFVRVMLFASMISFIDIFPRLDLISKIWIFVILLSILRKLAKLDWDAVGILVLILFVVSLLV